MTGLDAEEPNAVPIHPDHGDRHVRRRFSSIPTCALRLWASLLLAATASFLAVPSSGELLPPQRVTDLEPDPAEVLPFLFCPTRGGLIFVTRIPYFAHYPAYRTDGRIESTTPIQFPGQEPGQASTERIEACGPERTRALLFTYNGFTGSADDVWSTDGSAEGTIQLLSAFDGDDFHSWGEVAVLANDGPIIFGRSDEVDGTTQAPCGVRTACRRERSNCSPFQDRIRPPYLPRATGSTSWRRIRIIR